MRLSSAVLPLVCLLLPASSSAFAPRVAKDAALTSPLFRIKATLVSEPDAVHDLSDNISSKLESVMEKADDWVLKRLMVSVCV